MTAERPANPEHPVRVRRARSLSETLLSITLGLEAGMMFFAAMVVFGLDRFDPDWLALVYGAIAILVLVVVSRLQRFPAAVAVGAVLQLAIIAIGFLEPAMFLVGAVFAALWIYCFVRGRHIDAQKAAWLAGRATASESSAPPQEGDAP